MPTASFGLALLRRRQIEIAALLLLDADLARGEELVEQFAHLGFGLLKRQCEIRQRGGTAADEFEDALLRLGDGERTPRLRRAVAEHADRLDRNEGRKRRDEPVGVFGSGRRDEGFDPGTVEGVQLDEVDAHRPDQRCEAGDRGVAVVHSRNDEKFQIDAAAGVQRVPRQVGDEALEIEARRRTVDLQKLLGVGAVERRDHQIHVGDVADQRFVAEEHRVGEQTQRVLRVLGLDEPHHIADAGIERRLAGAGEGHEVEFRVLAQHRVEFPDHLVRGDALVAFACEVGGPSRLAVDAIERTGLGGHQIDAERDPEPPRSDGTENVSHDTINSL